MASSAETSQGPLKKRSVVSSFIIKEPKASDEGGKPMVALFKRSGKVNTYQHHWAPISGSIEKDDASPLAAAWRELHEETTLTPTSLELIRQGKSYTFGDPSVGREWTIYPFAYRLKAAESAIQTDWEHESWAWFDPMDVEDTEAFGGVPHLAKSLRRAWFEKDLGAGPGSAGAALARGLDQLKNDHQSGARQLAGSALSVLKDVIQALEVDKSSLEAWWTQVRFTAWHIWKNGRESMGAAILSVLLDALRSIESTLEQHHEEQSGSVGSAKWRDAAIGDLDQRIAKRASSSSAEPVAVALLQYLEKHFSTEARSLSSPPEKASKPLAILTLSESSTVAYFLQQLVSRSRFTSVDLRVLESRPLFEGVSLAASLVRHVQSKTAASPASTAKVNVTIYTDASAALAAEGVDVVLLGADRIASSGAVSNKTGSLPAVLSAKRDTISPGHATHAGSAKVVVLGETEKIATPGDPHSHVVEDNDPTQVARDWHSAFNSERVRNAADCLDRAMAASADAGGRGGWGLDIDVQVRNIFFEWVLPELIDAYATEHGMWTLQDISRHSAAIGKEEERLFSDL